LPFTTLWNATWDRCRAGDANPDGMEVDSEAMSCAIALAQQYAAEMLRLHSSATLTQTYGWPPARLVAGRKKVHDCTSSCSTNAAPHRFVMPRPAADRPLSGRPWLGHPPAGGD
jgi:hypothetical protein